MLVYILIFVLDLLKYWMGYQMFFGAEIHRKWVAALGGVAAVLIYVFWQPREEARYLFLYFFIIGLVCTTVREKWNLKILHMIMLLCVYSSLDGLFGVMFEEMFVPDDRIMIYAERLLPSFLTFLFLIGFYILSKKFSDIRKEKFRYIIRESSCILVALMAVNISLTIAGLLFVKPYLENEDLKVFLTVICCLSYLGICILVIFIIYIRYSNEQLEDFTKAERELKKMQQMFYEKLLEKEEETRGFRHDIDHHLLSLRHLAVSGELQRVVSYIDTIQKQVVEIKNKSHHTGSHILDLLVNYYASVCGEDVSFEVSGKCMREIKADDVDLCTIFSNLLQNAAEALKEEDNPRKCLKIEISQGNHHVGIRIINTSAGEDSQLFETGKEDKHNHGFGMRNVSEAVKKNGGAIVVKREGGEFIADVILSCH